MKANGDTGNKSSFWRQLSNTTHGVATPANIISIVGGLSIVLGFLQITNDEWAQGVVLVGLGRLMDIADGYVARHTKTSSTIGEFVDIVTDKLAVLIALLVIIAGNLMPIFVIGLIALQNVINATAGIIAIIRRLGAHASHFGKHATFFAWITIVSFLAARGFEINGHSVPYQAFSAVGYGFFTAFLWFGFRATLRYCQRALQFKK